MPNETPEAGAGQNVTVDYEALSKSIENLIAVTEARSGNRSQELGAKLQAGTITKDERLELAKSLAGETGLAQDMIKAFGANVTEQLQKSIDATPLIANTRDVMQKSLVQLATAISEAQDRSDRWSHGFAKTLIDVGNANRAIGGLLKSLEQRMEAIEKSPARAPIGVQALTPGTAPAGATPPGTPPGTTTQLTKGVCEAALRSMMQKSMEGNGAAVGGSGLMPGMDPSAIEAAAYQVSLFGVEALQPQVVQVISNFAKSMG